MAETGLQLDYDDLAPTSVDDVTARAAADLTEKPLETAGPAAPPTSSTFALPPPPTVPRMLVAPLMPTVPRIVHTSASIIPVAVTQAPPASLLETTRPPVLSALLIAAPVLLGSALFVGAIALRWSHLVPARHAAKPPTEETQRAEGGSVPPPEETRPSAPATDPNGTTAMPVAKTTIGILVLPQETLTHRVYLDGKRMATTASRTELPCGSHTLRIGSVGDEQQLTVPCGGEVTATAQ